MDIIEVHAIKCHEKNCLYLCSVIKNGIIKCFYIGNHGRLKYFIKTLPSKRTCSTQLIDVFIEEKGADKLASLSQNEIPTLAYFIAEQSLAPSPVMQTIFEQFCNSATI